MAEQHEPLLEVRALSKTYPASAGSLLRRDRFAAVQEVSFTVRRGETFGIVGESGCGKSTVARLIMALERPDSGQVLLEGQRIDNLPERRLRPLRPLFQMVFQDSGSSLNARKRVADILAEPMLYHQVVPREDVSRRVDELLSLVGLPAAARNRYPHELSGGMLQRVMIAAAIVSEPKLLLADEPTTALDVTIQAQILELLKKINREKGMTILFISHNLNVVRKLCSRVAVMHKGKMVEEGPADAVFYHPQDAYTQRLIAAIPTRDKRLR